LLVNTAQNVLDNNLDAVVPYSPLADGKRPAIPS
jgi:hypothetical protein